MKPCMISVLLAALLLLISPTVVSAQAPDNPMKFTRITLDQGLSHLNVNAILQDQNGFMWFGTDDGLNKYDGYNFTVYYHNAEDPNSLSASAIQALYEDGDGFIWIGTWSGGLNKFDPRTEQFTRYQYNEANPTSLSNDIVYVIYEDQTGALWIGTENGLNKFDRQTGQFTRYQHDETDPHSLSDSYVRSIYEDQAGTLWIGTQNGLNKFDRATGQFSHYFHDEADSTSLSHNTVTAIYQDQAGLLWIGTEGGGLNRFDPDTGQFTRYQHDETDPHSLSDDIVYTLYETPQGVFWVGTEGGGLNKFDRQAGQFTVYQNMMGDPTTIAGGSIRAIYEDSSEVLWVASGGLNLFDPYQYKFVHYAYDGRNEDPAKIWGGSIWGIYEDKDGILWVGGVRGGLNRIDRQTGQITHYINDENDPTSISENRVSTIYEDRSGAIWVGTRVTGLNKFDRATEQFTRYLHDENDPTSLSENRVYAIYEDSAGSLWVGTGAGVNLLDRTTGRFTRYQHDESDPTSLSDNRIWQFHEDRRGNFWVATGNGGLNKMDRATGAFTAYQHDPDNPNSLSQNGVLAIYEDADGILWLGTGGGLNKFDPVSETFIHYRRNDGLPNETINGILQDDQGYLWLNTNQGISRFDPQTETFRNYDVTDGVQAAESNVKAFFKNQYGEMFFGGPNGFNSFFPERVQDNPHPPRVVITNFQLFNEPVEIGPESPLKQTIYKTDELTLSYQDYVISFEFAALSYTLPDKNKYAFILEGFDQDWNYRDADNRFATYTNLPAGEYVFRVKGSNNDGVWNETGPAIKLTITPPWWETTWVRGLGLVVLIGSVAGAFQWRVRSIDAQRRQLEVRVQERTNELVMANDHLEQEIEERKRVEIALAQARDAAEAANRAKSEFLANMSHELRTPLNAILGFSQLMTRDPATSASQRENLSIIARSGEHLLTLINNVLEMSKIEAGYTALNEQNFDLHRLLDDLEDMFYLRATAKGVELIVDRGHNVPQYVYGDESKLRQILINLLGNAVKFTSTGWVMLRVSSKEDEAGSRGDGISNQEGEQSPLLLTPYSSLRFEVEDTGSGISPEEQGKLFVPFSQTESGQKSHEGTGLGLAISRQFVRLMGGDLTVASPAPLPLVLNRGKLTPPLPFTNEAAPGQVGPGCLFIFELTFKPGDESSEYIPQPSQRVIGLEPGQPAYRILIVEDRFENRALLRKLIEGVGFEVQEATNGLEGVERFESWQPHLIWMDMRMPVLDGYEATRRIKASTQGQAAVVIALTASAFEEQRAVVLSAGCDDFVRKPFQDTEIFEKMAKHLGVRYLYTDEQPEAKATTSPAKLNLADLAELPAVWVTELHAAASKAQTKRIEELLKQIRPDHPPLAEAIQGMVAQFRFDEIMRLTEISGLENGD